MLFLFPLFWRHTLFSALHQQHYTIPFILAWEFSSRSMSFYSFVVHTVLPAVLLFSWMLWEIIESAAYGAVCCSAPTSSCLVNTVLPKPCCTLPAQDSWQLRDVNTRWKLQPRSNRNQTLKCHSHGPSHFWLIYISVICPCLFPWENKIEADFSGQFMACLFLVSVSWAFCHIPPVGTDRRILSGKPCTGVKCNRRRKFRSLTRTKHTYRGYKLDSIKH